MEVKRKGLMAINKQHILDVYYVYVYALVPSPL